MVRLGRRRRRRRGRDGADTAIGERAGAAAYGLLGLLATLVDVIIGVIALIIALGILFVVLKANSGNTIVRHVHDAAKFLVGPFDGIFTPKNHRLAVAINWGIALVLYVIVGRLIARLLRRPRP
jgi:hypothetical protein